jgi:hypothetical protein
MPRKHTHKINRGGGPETEIQANIREELERIFCIFTLDETVRKAYTKSSLLDTTSNGAKLIDALRDLYSSKSMKGSEKATKRNELVVRIIKLVLNEPSIFRQHEISPVNAGYQHKFRVPIIPARINPLMYIEAYGLTLPSFILNTLGQCAGNVGNICRKITDDEAYENLRTVTSKIEFSENGQKLFDLYNNVKEYFDDDKRIVNSKEIARILFKKLFNSKLDTYFGSNGDGFKDDIHVKIQTNKLLYFISILYYYIVGEWQQELEYDDNYTRHILETIIDVRDEKTDEDDKTYKDEKKSPLHNNAGGANVQHRKKTSKKQRRHKRSTLLLKKK